MDQEALEVLEMVRDGKVTPEQGHSLLTALRSGAPALAAGGGERPRFVRVRVAISDEGEKKVSVDSNLPIAMADMALKMLEGAEFTKDGEKVRLGEYLKQLGGMDIATVLQMVKDGAEGKLVDVHIHDEGEEKVRVEVFVD